MDTLRRSSYQDGKMINEVIQDETTILQSNAISRSEQPEHFKFINGKVLHHVLRLSDVFIESMANGTCCVEGLKYRFYTPDMEEKKRALLHVQTSHREYMRMNGTPISKTKQNWV